MTIHRGMYKHHKGLHSVLTIGEKSLVALGNIVQELRESRGGRPGLSILTSLLVSMYVKIY